MIISVNGELIDTQYIYRISKLNLATLRFTIFFLNRKDVEIRCKNSFDFWKEDNENKDEFKDVPKDDLWISHVGWQMRNKEGKEKYRIKTEQLAIEGYNRIVEIWGAYPVANIIKIEV